jgi:hypothetical protein
MGIYINGGTVIASGNMYDRLEEGGQTYAVFSFAQSQKGNQLYSLRNESGEEVLLCNPQNDFSYLIISCPELAEGTYTLWLGETQLAHGGGMGGFGFNGMGGKRPENMPEGMTPPDKPDPDGRKPENFTINEDGSVTLPDGTTVTKEEMGQFRPDGLHGEKGPNFGGQRPNMPMNSENSAELSPEFKISSGANSFSAVQIAKSE